MYIVEFEDEGTGERTYKAFMVSSDAVDCWSTIYARLFYDKSDLTKPKMFKAKTNNVAEAIALTKAGQAEVFDFADLEAQVEEICGRLICEGDLSERRLEAEASKLLENPAICAVAEKAGELRQHKKARALRN